MKCTLIFLLLVGLSVIPTDAFAYIDPGTGSMAVQAALAIVAGALVAIKAYWSRIQHFFAARRDSRQDRKE